MPVKKLLILAFISMAGCSAGIPVDPTLATFQNSPNQATITSIPEVLSNQPQATIGQVASPRTATPTSIPTIAPEIQQEIFTKIIEGDSNCKLPCYGGIIPGKSKVQEAIQIFAPLSRDMGGDEGSYGFFLKPPSTYHSYANDVLILFRFTPDQTIHQIESARFEYPIVQLLNEYGAPDEIHIRPLNHALVDNPTWEPGMRVWDLAIYYGRQSILARYYVREEPGDEKLTLCPSQLMDYETQPWLFLWSPQERLSFDLLGDQMRVDLNQYKLIQVATDGNMDENRFYEVFMEEQNSSVCLLLNDLWEN